MPCGLLHTRQAEVTRKNEKNISSHRKKINILKQVFFTSKQREERLGESICI
jgi:hypothetical protein